MKTLAKTKNFAGVRPVLTIVMDGVGLAPAGEANAVSLARTPNLDKLLANYPVISLRAHGTAVGLPSDDDMGNSEVGHNALGSGQVFAQGVALAIRYCCCCCLLSLLRSNSVTSTAFEPPMVEPVCV